MIVAAVWALFFLEGAISFLFFDKVFICKYEDGISFTIVALNALFVFFAIIKIQNSNKEQFISIIVFLLLTLLIVFDRFAFPFDTSDSDAFHIAAVNQMNGITYMYGYGGVYVKLVSLLYSLFGELRMVAQYVNALLVFSSVYYLKKIFLILNLEKNARVFSFSLLLIVPFFYMHNAVLRRESVIEFLLIVSFFHFIKWMKTYKIASLLAALFFSLFAATFHSGVICVCLAYMIFFVLYDKYSKKFEFRWYSVIVVFLFVIAAFVVNASYGSVFLGKFQGKDYSQVEERLSQKSGGSGYIVPEIPVGNSIVKFIVNTPLRCIYYLFSPMPWDWRGPFDILAFVFSSLFYGIGYVAVINILKEKKIMGLNKYVLILGLLIFFLSSILFAWGVRNAGTAIRHRDKFIFIYLTMVAICNNAKNKPFIRIKNEQR